MKLEQLTFTRYLAALTVLFFHFGTHVYLASESWWSTIVTAGPAGVSYFFLLSGFVMAIAYYDPNKALNQKRYWLARIARIYPVYLLALSLVLAANLHSVMDDPLILLLNLSMLQAWIPGYAMTLNSPGWSLSVETFFYLSLPFLLLFIQHGHFRKLLIAGLFFWFSTQLLQTILQHLPSYAPRTPLHEFIFYHPLMHWSTFILGLISGIWYKEGKLTSLQSKWNGVFLFLVSALLVLLITYKEQWLGKGEYFNNGLLVPLFGVLIVLLASNTGWVARLFSWSFFVLLGEASYSLYILQRPVYGIYERLVGKYLTTMPELHFYLFVIILTGLAIMSFKYFESPLRQFINSFYVSSGKGSQHRVE